MKTITLYFIVASMRVLFMTNAEAHDVPMWGYQINDTIRLASIASATLDDILTESDMGESLDDADKLYAIRTLEEAIEYSSNGQMRVWRNFDSGHSGTATLVRTYRNDSGKDCVEFKTTLRTNKERKFASVRTVCNPSEEYVTFKSATGEDIQGIFIAPPESVTTPAPAVVMLHGCAGLFKNGEIPERERSWIEILHKQGLAILLPSSFASRGLGDMCGIPIPKRPIHFWEQRPYDAKGALTYLQSRDDINHDQIALMGWSNGAQAVLEYVRNGTPVESKLNENDFKTAVIFYPGCSHENDFSARIPTLIQHGKSDDWTPANFCQKMVEDAMKKHSAPIFIDTYAGSYHDFDHPSYKFHARMAGSYGEREVHQGANPEARVIAIGRTLEWLSAHLKN